MPAGPRRSEGRDLRCVPRCRRCSSPTCARPRRSPGIDRSAVPIIWRRRCTRCANGSGGGDHRRDARRRRYGRCSTMAAGSSTCRRFRAGGLRRAGCGRYDGGGVGVGAARRRHAVRGRGDRERGCRRGGRKGRNRDRECRGGARVAPRVRRPRRGRADDSQHDGLRARGFDVGRACAFDIEARSVNHRHLDLRVRLPRLLSAFESAARDCVQARLAPRQGRPITCRRPRRRSQAPALEIDSRGRPKAYARASESCRKRAVAGPLDGGRAARLPGVATLRRTRASGRGARSGTAAALATASTDARRDAGARGRGARTRSAGAPGDGRRSCPRSLEERAPRA